MTQSAPQTGISLKVTKTINAPRERVFAAEFPLDLRVPSRREHSRERQPGGWTLAKATLEQDALLGERIQVRCRVAFGTESPQVAGREGVDGEQDDGGPLGDFVGHGEIPAAARLWGGGQLQVPAVTVLVNAIVWDFPG